MLRKDNEALGNTLVTFTNKNNNSLQINSWLDMRSLWHGSKIDMSLALKRKWERKLALWMWLFLASNEVVGVLGSFRQLDENSVKLWKSLPKRKMGRNGRMRLEIVDDEVVGVLGSLRQLNENAVKLWKSLPKGKMGRDGRMRLEIAEFQG
ncbi:unnamed protein product [Prunus armeniaca]